MKSLNLDALIEKQEKRSITLGGKSYEVLDMTVENYIQTTLDANKLDAPDSTIVDQIEATIRMIKRSVPEIEEKILRSLSLEQLRVLVAFVRGENVEEEPGATEGESDAGK